MLCLLSLLLWVSATSRCQPPPNEIAPEDTLYIAGTVKAVDFLTELKQSYPGKAIIIDRWATWCLPCLKSKVMELKQPGVHILIDKTLDADISNYFSFSGYPGHALIDKTGQYKPGAIESMSQIQNRDALATLIGN